ncbi:MAG: hypothetical protein RL341_2261 [Pseudomonadota bacterium]|jgi:hypothetical protein
MPFEMSFPRRRESRCLSFSACHQISLVPACAGTTAFNFSFDFEINQSYLSRIRNIHAGFQEKMAQNPHEYCVVAFKPQQICQSAFSRIGLHSCSRVPASFSSISILSPPRR